MTASELYVQGISVNSIAEKFGTPLYLYDSNILVETLRNLRKVIPPRLEVFYSLKANPNISVYSTLLRAGARAEVSSLVELRTALLAGTKPKDIIFLGPGKSRTEIDACLEVGIFAIICESLAELALIDEMARSRHTTARVALRVNPSFSVKGSGLTMGGKPRQFGVDDVQLLTSEPLANAFQNVELMGVQVYLGTRILDESVVVKNTEKILELAEQISTYHRFPLDMVDIGGGLGVAYFDGERDIDVEALGRGLHEVMTPFLRRHPSTRLVMELGRFLTANAGTYIARVRFTKSSRDENFAIADGGTNHHMAAVGVGSFVHRNFPISLVSRATSDCEGLWNITGPLCTPNDLIARNVALPPLRRGDLVAVGRSGAYGPTASPVQFLSHGYPAEVLVMDGTAHLVRVRDTVETFLDRQVLVEPKYSFAP